MKVAVTFVVDDRPDFVANGYALVRSIRARSESVRPAIYVHVLPEVVEDVRVIFREEGCIVREIQRFGDGKFCNKIQQLQSFIEKNYEYVLMMDTDMIVVGPLAPVFSENAVRARVVGRPMPSLETLAAIATEAGMAPIPPTIESDCRPGTTFAGNSNSGTVLVPSVHIATLYEAWARWAMWLLERRHLLEREKKIRKAEQVALWLAMQMEKIPYRPLPGNWNYNPRNPLHRSMCRSEPISVLHYHGDRSEAGLPCEDSYPEFVKDAVLKANRIFSGLPHGPT